MEYFAFNHDRPAFKGVGQIPLKQAINWAIDRPALVRAAGYDAGSGPTSCCPRRWVATRASTHSET